MKPGSEMALTVRELLIDIMSREYVTLARSSPHKVSMAPNPKTVRARGGSELHKLYLIPLLCDDALDAL